VTSSIQRFGTLFIMEGDLFDTANVCKTVASQLKQGFVA